MQCLLWHHIAPTITLIRGYSVEFGQTALGRGLVFERRYLKIDSRLMVHIEWRPICQAFRELVFKRDTDRHRTRVNSGSWSCRLQLWQAHIPQSISTNIACIQKLVLFKRRFHFLAVTRRLAHSRIDSHKIVSFCEAHSTSSLKTVTYKHVAWSIEVALHLALRGCHRSRCARDHITISCLHHSFSNALHTWRAILKRVSARGPRCSHDHLSRISVKLGGLRLVGD